MFLAHFSKTCLVLLFAKFIQNTHMYRMHCRWYWLVHFGIGLRCFQHCQGTFNTKRALNTVDTVVCLEMNNNAPTVLGTLAVGMDALLIGNYSQLEL
jgi:hypothetical protein